MSSTILVTGGTGTLGKLVVPRLVETGSTVRVLTRTARPAEQSGITYLVGDLETGDGVDAAMVGVATVVHCAGSSKGDDVKARRLVDAAKRSGVQHIVYISVVGADRIPMVGRIDRAAFGYFGAKREAERIISSSGIPWTTLRATQFHDLALTTVEQMCKMPVVPTPSFHFQPVDASEVADRLVELALGEPAGLVPDLAGPTAYSMKDLVRSYLKASGKHRMLVPMWMPGHAAKAVRGGANLALDRGVGKGAWEAFLAERVH
jgi:uncharacterized protein YbjT (DUF2867 family)